MPLQLLPATAQAFAKRSPPSIVLNSKVEPWLTQTLKRVNKIKRPLNSVPQHFRCLTETLGHDNAMWALCSIMLPKAPDSELRRDSDPLVEGLFNFQLLHVEAYVVHVDMVSQNEVAFKLTNDTIDMLIEYHKEIFSVDTAATTPWDWPEKDAQLKKLQDEFVQAANRFVFRTGVRALEGMEEDGAGELLEGRSLEVQTAITNLFSPLMPPPPRIVDVIHPQQQLLPNPELTGNWWAPAPMLNTQPGPVDSWRVLPSTPSPTATSCSDNQSNGFWPDMNFSNVQLPSPTPSFSMPFTSAPSHFYSSPECMAPIPVMPLPSQLPHCGGDMGMGGFNDFGWSQSSFAPHYATAI